MVLVVRWYFHWTQTTTVHFVIRNSIHCRINFRWLEKSIRFYSNRRKNNKSSLNRPKHISKEAAMFQFNILYSLIYVLTAIKTTTNKMWYFMLNIRYKQIVFFYYYFQLKLEEKNVLCQKKKIVLIGKCLLRCFYYYFLFRDFIVFILQIHSNQSINK